METVEEIDHQERNVHFNFGVPIKIPSPNIRIDNGLFYYNPENVILDKIDFQLDMNSRVALLGPNGIGKTTLINIIMEKVKLV